MQAKQQPVLRGIQPWQRSNVAAAAVRAWARWGATFSNAASLAFALTAYGLAAAGCDWAPAAARRLAAADHEILAQLPDAPVMLVSNLRECSARSQLASAPAYKLGSRATHSQHGCGRTLNLMLSLSAEYVLNAR